MLSLSVAFKKIGHANHLSFLLVLMLISSCATSSKKSDGDDGDESSSKKSKDAKREAEAAADNADDEEIYVSGAYRAAPLSLTNNQYTSKTVSRKEAAEIAQKIESSLGKDISFKDRKTLLALMNARRLGGARLSDVLEVAKKVLALEMSKKSTRDLAEVGKLELVLAAIRDKKLSFAEYFIADLLRSKRKDIRAAAFTAQGMIAAMDERLPEAVLSWNKALEADESCEAAQLNLAFVALHYGDFAKAKKYLGPRQGQWFESYGLITSDRLLDDSKSASRRCDEVTRQKPDHKPALFNCALHESQGGADLTKAKAYLGRMMQISGDNKFDEKAAELEQKISRKALKAKQDDAKEEKSAKESKESKEKESPKTKEKEESK